MNGTRPPGNWIPLRPDVLADALEEAGAPVELVAHLRSPGPMPMIATLSISVWA
jgi:hypothetical protein